MGKLTTGWVMSWLAYGFISLFDWAFPKTAAEILDDFYLDHPADYDGPFDD